MSPLAIIDKIYSVDLLVTELNSIPFDEEIKKFKEHWIEFKDCTVSLRGYIHGTFEYEDGDFFSPPSATQIAQCAEFSEIIIGYEENTEFLSGSEIGEIEDKLRW